MRRFSTLVTVLALMLSFSLVSAGDNVQVDWKAFSKSLTRALKSDNPGIQTSAMRMVIRHGDKVDVTTARYEVMDVFLKNSDQKVRQLALVTLYTINHPLDIGFLERRINFEEDPVIKKHLAAVVAESRGLVPVEEVIPMNQYASTVPLP